MKLLVLLMITLSCTAASFVSDDEWQNFKTLHSKTYGSLSEESYRRNIFTSKFARIAKHNVLYDRGLKSYSLGLNQMSDLTSDDINSRNGLRVSPNTTKPRTSLGHINVLSLPATVDWRDKKIVTDVKDQKTCGSCWAFAAVAAVEGQHALVTKKLVSLSEQNLVDCDKVNDGCEGGLMEYAYEYIIANKGIDTSKSYKYRGKKGDCRFKLKKVGATISSYVTLESGNEDALLKAVATVGPVAVGIDASDEDFQDYSDGIYVSTSCSNFFINHAVTVVGYGTEKGLDYWLVKNSWGKKWGKKGYIKMARNTGNMCGIATYADYPVV